MSCFTADANLNKNQYNSNWPISLANMTFPGQYGYSLASHMTDLLLHDWPRHFGEEYILFIAHTNNPLVVA